MRSISKLWRKKSKKIKVFYIHGQKTWYVKISDVIVLIYRIETISVKITANHFENINKLTLGFKWKAKDPEKLPSHQNRRRKWRTNTAWLQGHYKAIVIAIMNYSQGIGQQTESPRIDLHRHHQVTCNKEQMQFNIEMIVFNKQCQNN